MTEFDSIEFKNALNRIMTELQEMSEEALAAPADNPQSDTMHTISQQIAIAGLSLALAHKSVSGIYYAERFPTDPEDESP